MQSIQIKNIQIENLGPRIRTIQFWRMKFCNLIFIRTIFYGILESTHNKH